MSNFVVPCAGRGFSESRCFHAAELSFCSRGVLYSEATFGPHIVEIAQVVVDADVIEHAAQAAHGDAHAVGAAEAAELAAAFQVRLQVEEHAGNAALGQLLLQLRDQLGEVAQDPLVAAVAQVGRHEVLEHVFVDVAIPEPASDRSATSCCGSW